MQLQPRTLVMLCFICAAVGAGIAKKFAPDIQTVEKEVAKEKIVERIVERTNPDGSTEKTTERTEERKDTKSKTEVALAPQWRVQAAGGVGVDLQPQYRLGVERRIMGPIWAGAYVAAPRNELGVTLSVEF